MYICKECGNIFGHPYIGYGERLEHFGRPCMEIIHASPCCKADFKDATKCAVCDEYIVGKYASVIDGQKICENCYCVCHILDE